MSLNNHINDKFKNSFAYNSYCIGSNITLESGGARVYLIHLGNIRINGWNIITTTSYVMDSLNIVTGTTFGNDGSDEFYSVCARNCANGTETFSLHLVVLYCKQ